MKNFFKKYNSTISFIFFISIGMALVSVMMMLGLSMDEKKWLQVIYCILFIIIFIMLAIVFGRIAASKDYALTNINSHKQERGETIDIKERIRGFYPLKAYLIGFLLALPLLIMLIIALSQNSNNNDLNGALKCMYCLYYLPLYIINAEISIAVMFYAIPLNIAFCGVFYHLYGIKLKLQLQDIKQEKEKIKARANALNAHIYRSKQQDVDNEDKKN